MENPVLSWKNDEMEGRWLVVGSFNKLLGMRSGETRGEGEKTKKPLQ
jgi:hypothetical protein